MEIKILEDNQETKYRSIEISGEIKLEDFVSNDSFKEELLSLNSLKIKLKNIPNLEPAGFEFFYALKNSYLRDKKSLVVSASFTDEMSVLLERCGLKDIEKILSC